MTIELGFASWSLPSGRRVGIVDVPGHRRFVRTMVAGAQGIDLLLLVVAASEGVMPQTREHLAICELLGVRHAVVALTKVDLVDGETAAVARAEVEELVAGSGLCGAPIVECSAVTRAGLEALVSAVDGMLERANTRPDRGVPRLFIDRAFSMAGFGPVVTGTLDNGSFEIGDEVIVLPTAQRARIRGLQHHGESALKAEPGMRTAVNLSGIDRRELRRGMAVVKPGTVVTTTRADCWIEVAREAPAGIQHRAQLEVHLGTAELPGVVWLLEGAELAPGEAGFGRLDLGGALPAVPGDRFVLRRASMSATVGGGAVLDVAPRRHRRKDPAAMAALRHRREGGPGGLALEALRQIRLGLEPSRLAPLTGLAAAPLAEEIAALGEAVVRVGPRWLAAERWAELRDAAIELIAAYHAASPLRQGMPREELGARLRAGRFTGPIIDTLVAAGNLGERGSTLALPGWRPTSSATESVAAEAGLALLRRRGLEAATSPELEAAGLSRELQRMLVADGRIVRLGDGVVVDAETYGRARAVVESHLREHGEATVATLRTRLGATRRVVVPLLEHLDNTRVTVRAGDVRRLRASR